MLGERPRPLQAVGAGFIIAGVVLTRRPGGRPLRRAAAPEG